MFEPGVLMLNGNAVGINSNVCKRKPAEKLNKIFVKINKCSYYSKTRIMRNF